MNLQSACTSNAIINLEPIHFEARAIETQAPIAAIGDWKTGLPVLRGSRMMLRELIQSDAAGLLSMLSTEEVARFISPPPTTVQAFERFVGWAQRERQAGRQLTYGIVPEGYDQAVGLVQVRSIGANFSVAEIGFAVGSPFWGTGLFMAGARMTFDFAFQHTGVNRLEARAVVENGRGNKALRKLGAVSEAVLRRSLIKGERAMDQILWSILAQDWYSAKATWEGSIQ